MIQVPLVQFFFFNFSYYRSLAYPFIYSPHIKVMIELYVSHTYIFNVLKGTRQSDLNTHNRPNQKKTKNKKQQQQIIKGSRENYIKNIICYFSYKMVRYYLRIKWLDILVGRSLHQCIERKVHDHISRLIYYHMTFSKN